MSINVTPQMQAVYEKLKKVRTSTTISLKPCNTLKSEVTTLKGTVEPFNLRYYQVQGAYHMMLLKRMILGDACGLGKTVESIAALAYVWEAEPSNKILVLAPKSAVRQWASEIHRFTNGVRTIIPVNRKGMSAVDARKQAYNEWLNASGKAVLIMNYSILVRDWYHESFQPPGPDGKPNPKAPVVPGLFDKITSDIGTKQLVVLFDECTSFKSKKTKTWEVARFLSLKAHRVYGLTATLLKNKLYEGYCIYGVIRPGLFTTQKDFYDRFCFVELKKVGKARVPIVKGYKNLDEFRKVIDPYFLGRQKHTVASELPTLVTREVNCLLSPPEDLKYKEALSGVLELGDGEVKDYDEHKALVALIYCQKIVNSMTLIKFEEGKVVSSQDGHDIKQHKVSQLGAKEQALVDLITGELVDEKVIVYTRFASLVDRLQAILKKEGTKSTRITGKDDDKSRQNNQKLFQDSESGVDVIFITDAGSEAINLQMAIGMIFYDSPWSWGNYIQCLGRMIRIGSPHKGVLAFHLLAEMCEGYGDDSTTNTIDHHVLSLLRKKRNLIDKVLGEGAVGALKFDKSGTDAISLIKAMQGHKDGM